MNNESTDFETKDFVNEEVNHEEEVEVEEELFSALSTQALEQKLITLREQSNKHSQTLTQKLATSQSGQNLLHIGSSLSTLPPDLHALLTQLHPVLSAAETSEKQHLSNLQKLVTCGNEIRVQQRRLDHASQCAELYEDLLAAERHVQRDAAMRKRNVVSSNSKDEGEAGRADELDHVASLERSACTALSLIQDLHASSEQVSALTSKLPGTESSNLPSIRSPLDSDTERAQFVMKLAPRIRRLESDAILSLTIRLESILKQIQRESQISSISDEVEKNGTRSRKQKEELMIVGHCLGGLALLGKAQEAESIFARVAIMPLIRAKVSMGRLDEGGSRGECAGLFSLLNDMSNTIASSFGNVLRFSESMFNMENSMEVDLVTAGVWVPIATALMADAGISMAIFSPGITSILQSNYTSLDSFLSGVASTLLNENKKEASQHNDSGMDLYSSFTITPDIIRRAQKRIYSHPKTTELFKKWNLSIYYQLRFGDSCSRLNNAIEKTRREGWIAEVFGGGGNSGDVVKMKSETGFELSLFIEILDIISSFWKSDVFLRPLSHRFLRGAVQIICRCTSFISDGLDGNIKFGQERKPPIENGDSEKLSNGDDDILAGNVDKHVVITRDPYCWGEIVEDVATVAWDMTIFESRLTHEYIEEAKRAINVQNCSEEGEIGTLIKEVITDAVIGINPLVQKAWNEVIVRLLIAKCCGPLAAVKGVAATYRMTNRPPPTQSSPFVPTILRPLRDFNDAFRRKIPPKVGVRWKISVVTTVSQRYAMAVEELIATVQRTEVALQNRRARRTVAGGMSDGEKVKRQLFLDYKEFSKNVQNVGIDPNVVEGIVKLQTLTKEAEDQ
eukprot:CAMPEP_0178897296 /NCGR_PEP_ID=MMETSP0786-20121207/1664_1 /TAXON_ID=186022 /ORGANISM="Thalassionema frauenfeldii, Strain CCMP 1798" /LENGTH=848 /DNA_ID=CAMNT_0020567823 /DNA_START=55 /DNA_END=2601 /DNA_ORIENTATION=-